MLLRLKNETLTFVSILRARLWELTFSELFMWILCLVLSYNINVSHWKFFTLFHYYFCTSCVEYLGRTMDEINLIWSSFPSLIPMITSNFFFHHPSPHLRSYNRPKWRPAPGWPDSSTGAALHRHRRSQVRFPRLGPNFHIFLAAALAAIKTEIIKFI